LTNLIRSLKRLTLFLTFITVLAVSAIYIFDLAIAIPINLPMFVAQAVDIIIILAFWLTAILFLRRLKPLVTPHLGTQAATIIQYVMLGVAVLIMTFGVLNTLGFSAQSLLTSAGIISVTAGLIVSTFVGGILSGALIFATHQLKVGDDIMVNNIPGKVKEMTALVIRIRTDVGQMSIPNSAIASGGVIVTAVLKPEAAQESRLHYTVGDRVITLYLNEQGTVTELTAFHTTVLLDSGKEITFLNNSVLSGTVAVAKITQKHQPN
jgi:small-conductance mechanosensitive channel